MGFLQALGDAGFDLSSVISGGGLATIVILFATDRILSLGQHKRRIADLEKAHTKEVADLGIYHQAEVVDVERRYSEMKESRDYYRAGRNAERERAEKLTDQLGESLELTKTAIHALTSLDEAAKGSGA